MSAADTWHRTDGTDYPTGYWAEEVAAPFERFIQAGWTVGFASPGGVLQPLDQHIADPGFHRNGTTPRFGHARDTAMITGVCPAGLVPLPRRRR